MKSGGGATRPLRRDGSVEEFCGDLINQATPQGLGQRSKMEVCQS